MLSWVGKRPLRSVTAFPAQPIEIFDPLGELKAKPDSGGLLLHGDNKECLAWLLANGYRGSVNLIYIDPPFDSGADYVRRVSLRGPKGAVKVEGETYSLGEQIQYTDIWANDNYLQFMYERLLLLKELLADGGSFFLHCDSSKGHFLRCIADEIFGAENFVNEIVWSYRRWPSDVRAFQAMHDTILFYGKEIAKKRPFLRLYEEASESYMKRFGGKTQILDEVSGTRKITSEEDTKGMPVRDVWELSIIAGFKGERVGYPTQKPEEILDRIIRSCSVPGDLVLDGFLGSGTTAAVAQKLGRRWIGCDINKGAIQTASKRLQSVIAEQIAAEKNAQSELLSGADTPPLPAQRAFRVARVNDYDLQIQHNEAVALACEHLGVTRIKNDAFFEGLQGKRLVKIVPFGHPLSPPDLEEIKRELATRKNDERDVLVVCLGQEHATTAWLADWSKLRRKGDVPNKIEIVELRTDPKYGRFIAHQPAQAKVSVKRAGDEMKIVIEDFISPSILERLRSQAGLLQPQIDDWRAMVDSVMIDPAYKGEVFNIVLSDQPERKTDLVAGSYALPAPKGQTTVAIKLTDMLGEEVLITQKI